MYPPRRYYDSLTKNKSPNIQPQYTSPLHKDANKVNKILQNTKRYEQIKQQKRGYMMQGIMNLQRKPSQQQQNSRKKRQSQLSNKSSDGCEEQKKDIYRKAQSSDYRYEQTTRLDHQRVPSQNKQKDNLNQQQKQLLTGKYENIDNLNNFRTQGYKNLNQGISSGIPNTYNNKYQDRNGQNNFQQSRINNQYVYKTRQYQNQSQIPHSNNIISSTLNNQIKQQNIAHTPQYIASQNFQQKYATNNTYNKMDQKSQNNRTGNSPSSINNNNNQLNRVTSQPQLDNKRQQNFVNDNNYSKTNQLTTNNITNSINNNQIKNNPANNTSNPQNNTITITSPTNSQTQQRLINNSLQQYNNAKTGEQKKQILLKSFHDKQYVQKLETGEKQNEQNKFIKTQMDKLITQANQMRNKFYKAEEERIVLIEKCRVLQQQNNKVRAQNEQLKLKYKNSQFQINSLQSYKSLAENQMQQLRNNKQSIYDDLIRKMNQHTIQLRKKSLQITKYQRIISQLQSHTNDKNYEINRLKQLINRKQQQNLQLQQKQYQLNKLNSQNNKTDIQVKSYIDKISNLQKEIANFKDSKNNITRLQTQLSKYRKKMQEMVQDMKDLQMQLQVKDKVIMEYKSYDYRNMIDNRVKMVERQLQLVMKQKSQIAKNYEQKLLEKDKRISQIQSQSQSYDSAIRTTKISGIESGEAAFQDILNQQLQQINNLKRQNLQKTNQVFTTKTQLQNLRCQLQNQQNKIKILNLQIQSGAKNAQSITQSHLRAARNQIDSLNRRIQIFNNTIESKRKQNLNKDQFIKKYLLANNKDQDVSSLVVKLQRILNNKT